VAERNFIFTQNEGKLLYSDNPFVLGEAVDLLAENPARVIQIQRRINGDVPVREGLSRLLCWSALFAIWSIRDWLALGEIGWKPWRIGVYQEGIDEEQIDGLVKVLERVGSTGVGVIPDTMELNVEWPQSNRASASGDHQTFFVTIGREMSKAVLGTTSSVEESTLGDRAATQTRDQLRVDIRKRDAIMLASFLRTQLFAYVISVNLGEDRPVPLPWFQADDAVDMVTFSKAIVNMSMAGVRLSQRWCRGEMGAPEPEDGEEVIGTNARAPGSRSSEKDPPAPGASGGTNEGANQGTDPAAAA
jgi:phage gp29-like protein